jgi:hypothetical protein
LLKGEVAKPPAAIASTTAADVARRTNAVVVTIPDEEGAEPIAVPADAHVASAPIVKLAEPTRHPESGRHPERSEGSLEHLTVTITKSADGLKLEPSTLKLSDVGQTARIVVAADAEPGIAMFVRDEAVVALNAAKRELHGVKKGGTELYVVGGGKMYILPVTVDGKGSSWDLQIPAALVSLDGVLSSSGTSALIRTPELSTPTSLVNDAIVTAATPRAIDEAVATPRSERPTYKPLQIQVVDDRSTPSGTKLYPVGGMEVRLVGTEFRGVTDSTGQLTIPDMPSNSRFLLALNDQTGAVRAGVAEIDTLEEGLERIIVMRQLSFDTISQVIGQAQDANFGSLCGTFTNAERLAHDGLSVSFDLEVDGPYFFNRFGFLDLAQHVTGPDGRFCAFNVPAGPVAVTVYEDGAPLATMPLAVHAGRHSEELLPLAGAVQLSTRLATLPTAHEQLNADPRVASGLRTIDMIDLIPLGTDSPMMQMQAGLVSSVDRLQPVRGRFFAYAQAAEFEPAVYSYESARRTVTPLLPRGFVEDMSVYAQVSHDPALGTIVAEYNVHAGIDADDHISFKLLDVNNQEVSSGWHFADRPASKAMFFNVPAGTYAIVAETGDGFWLGSETVTVYNETVSYARLGAPWK